MTIPQAIIDGLNERKEWFTVTRVTIRVSPSLGGYLMDVEGPVQETIGAMRQSGELGGIEAISGIVHSPDRSWRYAFRVDESGASVAANTPPEALQKIAPLLSEVTTRS